MPRPSSNPLRIILGSKWTYRIVAFAIFATLWEWFAIQAHSLLIPKFTTTMQALGKLVTAKETLDAFLISNQSLVIGFAIAAVLGIPLGFAAARYKRVEQYADPYLNILLVTPMAALIPILLMSVGIGLASRVILVVVFAIPVIIVNSRAGVRSVDPSLIEMSTSFGASERTIWRRILFPGSLPAVMTGIRLGLGRAVTGMVIVELLLVSVGIGSLILKFRGNFQPGPLYAVVILVVLEAFILITIARRIESRVAHWATHATLSE
jgi:NitT/TauT family transport system permease protein